MDSKECVDILSSIQEGFGHQKLAQKAITFAIESVGKVEGLDRPPCELCFTYSWDPVPPEYKTNINTLTTKDGEKYICSHCQLQAENKKLRFELEYALKGATVEAERGDKLQGEVGTLRKQMATLERRSTGDDCYISELRVENQRLKKSRCGYMHMGKQECIKQDAVNNICEENDKLKALVEGLPSEEEIRNIVNSSEEPHHRDGESWYAINRGKLSKAIHKRIEGEGDET